MSETSEPKGNIKKDGLKLYYKYIIDRGESQEPDIKIMHFSDDQAVLLGWDGTRYFVYHDGYEYSCGRTAVQMANPMIAIDVFCQCLREHLRTLAKKQYLTPNGFNAVMGCKIDISCADCRAYKLNTAENHCIERA